MPPMPSAPPCCWLRACRPPPHPPPRLLRLPTPGRRARQASAATPRALPGQPLRLAAAQQAPATATLALQAGDFVEGTLDGPAATLDLLDAQGRHLRRRSPRMASRAASCSWRRTMPTTCCACSPPIAQPPPRPCADHRAAGAARPAMRARHAIGARACAGWPGSRRGRRQRSVLAGNGGTRHAAGRGHGRYRKPAQTSAGGPPRSW